MAETHKILGQSAPSATTETALYTVPASTSSVISTMIVCNRGATGTTFRISIDQAGGGTANKDYLYYDIAIGANDTFATTVGITLDATDVINVYAGNANLSFSAFGVERT